MYNTLKTYTFLCFMHTFHLVSTAFNKNKTEQRKTDQKTDNSLEQETDD